MVHRGPSLRVELVLLYSQDAHKAPRVLLSAKDELPAAFVDSTLDETINQLLELIGTKPIDLRLALADDMRNENAVILVYYAFINSHTNGDFCWCDLRTLPMLIDRQRAVLSQVADIAIRTEATILSANARD